MRLLPAIFLTFSITTANGQFSNDPVEIIKGKFERYCENLPREEIYVHSDRGEYIAGELMWLKIFHFNRVSNTLTDYQTLAYLELINSAGDQILRKKIILDKGIADASVTLPDTLSSGRYRLRVYTNWMKNFLPNNCFSRDFGIYNVLDKNIHSVRLITRQERNCRKETESAYNDVCKSEMSVNRQKKDTLQITVHLNSEIGPGVSEYVILVRNGGILNYVKKISFDRDRPVILLPEDCLSQGINQIVLFDKSLNTLGEKLLFSSLTNPESSHVECSDTVPNRSRVGISFQTGSVSRGKRKPEFSVSVTEESSVDFFPDMSDYMIFGTEFGDIEFLKTEKRLKDIDPSFIDSAMTGIRSNWINWHNVVSEKYVEIMFRPEKNCHFLTGRALDKNSGQPLSGKNVFLSFTGKVASFQHSETDSTGSFIFTLPLTDHVFDIVIQTEDPDLNSSIMIVSPFSHDRISYDTLFVDSAEHSPDHIRRMGINYQVTRIYGVVNQKESSGAVDVFPGMSRFYGKPDIELIMDDYIRLPLMEEVFFELTPGVVLKKKKDVYFMVLNDPVTEQPYEKDPVVMVDGVILNNLTPLAALEPDRVEKIDIVKDMYMAGKYIFYGIVNVITRKGNLEDITLSEDAVRLSYRPSDRSMKFTSPDYSDSGKSADRIPDFRNTLHWNSMMDYNGADVLSSGFWSSDIDAAYNIDINGTDASGHPFSLHSVFIVK